MFGRGYSRDHPDLTAAVMLSASLDFHGLTLARAVRDVVIALLEDSSPPEMTACFVGPRSCARSHSRPSARRRSPARVHLDQLLARPQALDSVARLWRRMTREELRPPLPLLLFLCHDRAPIVRPIARLVPNAIRARPREADFRYRTRPQSPQEDAARSYRRQSMPHGRAA
jgi:hypothetical protein